jgi:hypothetical protein
MFSHVSLEPTPIYLHPGYKFATYFFAIYFNILRSTLKSPSDLYPTGVRINIQYVFLISPPVLHIPPISSPIG